MALSNEQNREPEEEQEQEPQEPQQPTPQHVQPFLFEKDLAVLAPERRGWREGLALLGLGGLGFASFLAAGFGPGLLGLLVMVIGAIAIRRKPRPLLTQRIGASREGLSIDGRHALRRDQIVMGVFEPGQRQRHNSSVRLIGENGESIFEAHVETKTDGLALLRALGVDAEHRRVELASLSPLVARARSAIALITMLVLALAGAIGGYAAGVAWLLPLLIPLVALAAIPTRVVVGIDGVFVRWLHHRRFVSAKEIVNVRPNGEAGIDLELRSGERMVLAATSAIEKRAGRERDTLIGRIREVIEIHRSREQSVDLRKLLERAGRAPAEWAAALLKLGSGGEGGGGYRTAPLRGDDLLTIACDPTATEDARAAAAFLMQRGSCIEGSPEDHRERIRIAAEATASPKLRVALESAASASTSTSDADVIHALEPFDEESASERGEPQHRAQH